MKNAIHSYAAAVTVAAHDKDEANKYSQEAEQHMIELLKGINELVDAKLAERLGPPSRA
jgi:hypothetical protein